jgi:hypothetical protein
MALLVVNNQRYTVDLPSDTPLLWVLRDHLHLVGTKYGCGMALCGACTVLVDGVAQMEGGIGFGLAAALHSAITLKEGVVEQLNFHQYPPLRINEMPKVEVHIVASTEKPTGVGEPGTPVIAPAVANAIAAATGKRLRSLPLVIA